MFSIIKDDLKYAFRLLYNDPGFSVLTTLVMAVGIGISTYLFSFLNTMVYKSLPFEEGESLIVLSSSQNGVRNGGSINLLDYYEIKDNLKGLSELSAYSNTNVNISARDGARRYPALIAEPNIFQLTRTKPLLGRGFTIEESQDGAENVAVIGYDIWQNQFGGTKEIIGQSVHINTKAYQVIGVMPKGYAFPGNAEIWLPIQVDRVSLTRKNAVGVYGFGRLDKNTSINEINRNLLIIMQRLEERYPKTNSGIGAYAEKPRMSYSGVGDGVPVIYSMYIIAILILILASINAGNLLLTRAVMRSKETAVRVALGAPRSRLISQMMWESIIICCIGGTIALLLINWGLHQTERVIAAFAFGKQLYWLKFGLDAYTIKSFIGIVLVTIFMTGFIPAWRNSGGDFNSVLRDGTSGAQGKKAGRLNRLLVISEIFISMTILIAAGVMLLTNYIKTHADNGADVENTLTAEVFLSKTSHPTEDQKIQFINALQASLENTTGIGDVMIISSLPGVWADTPAIALEGKEYNTDNTYPRANHILVTPGTLGKLGVELKAGRYFHNGDNDLGKKTVIVTQSFVERYYPNNSPLGKRLRITEYDGDAAEWLTIVGVVEHTIHADDKMPSIFRPFAQNPEEQMTVAMRIEGSAMDAVNSLRMVLKSIDPELPAFRIESYVDKIYRLIGPRRFGTAIFLLFGIAAVILSASGIYGVMSNMINQSTREIGVKRALGAWEQRVMREYMIKGINQLLLGGIPGLLAGLAMGFVMGRVSGVGSMGMLSVSSLMALIVVAVVMVATYYPTKRAIEMEPGEALHYE